MAFFPYQLITEVANLALEPAQFDANNAYAQISSKKFRFKTNPPPSTAQYVDAGKYQFELIKNYMKTSGSASPDVIFATTSESAAFDYYFQFGEFDKKKSIILSVTNTQSSTYALKITIDVDGLVYLYKDGTQVVASGANGSIIDMKTAAGYSGIGIQRSGSVLTINKILPSDSFNIVAIHSVTGFTSGTIYAGLEFEDVNASFAKIMKVSVGQPIEVLFNSTTNVTRNTYGAKFVKCVLTNIYNASTQLSTVTYNVDGTGIVNVTATQDGYKAYAPQSIAEYNGELFVSAPSNIKLTYFKLTYNETACVGGCVTPITLNDVSGMICGPSSCCSNNDYDFTKVGTATSVQNNGSVTYNINVPQIYPYPAKSNVRTFPVKYKNIGNGITCSGNSVPNSTNIVNLTFDCSTALPYVMPVTFNSSLANGGSVEITVGETMISMGVQGQPTGTFQMVNVGSGTGISEVPYNTYNVSSNNLFEYKIGNGAWIPKTLTSSWQSISGVLRIDTVSCRWTATNPSTTNKMSIIIERFVGTTSGIHILAPGETKTIEWTGTCGSSCQMRFLSRFVKTPTFTSISPNAQFVGDNVIISGTNLRSDVTSNTYFNTTNGYKSLNQLAHEQNNSVSLTGSHNFPETGTQSFRARIAPTVISGNVKMFTWDQYVELPFTVLPPNHKWYLGKVVLENNCNIQNLQIKADKEIVTEAGYVAAANVWHEWHWGMPGLGYFALPISKNTTISVKATYNSIPTYYTVRSKITAKRENGTIAFSAYSSYYSAGSTFTGYLNNFLVSENLTINFGNDFTYTPPSNPGPGTPGCLLAGEKLYVSDDFTTLKNVEDIEVGDEVWTAHETTKVFDLYPVTAKEIVTTDKWFKVITENGHEVRCSATHLFMVNGVKKPIETIDIENDKLTIFVDGSLVDEKIETIETIHEEVEVYKFEVADAHTYFTENKIWQHNKKQLANPNCSCCYGYPPIGVQCACCNGWRGPVFEEQY